MPVIGRLDDQVDAVLIAPLDKNRSDKQSTPDAHQQQPDEPATPISQSAQTPDEDESSQNARAQQEELPVWLL